MAGYNFDINWDEIATSDPTPDKLESVVPASPPTVARTDRALPSRREMRERATSTSRAKPARVRPPRALKTARPQAKAARTPRRGLLPRLLTVGAMLGAGALLVSTSLPAVAFEPSSADAAVTTLSSAPLQPVQKLAVESTVLAATAIRDSYTVENLAIAAKMVTANQGYLFTNNPSGTIQWPFSQSVPVSSGFGARQVANCSFCSTYHEGLDFVPGFGVPIQAIADGIVSEAGTTGPFGNHVILDHVINGQKVQTLYAHMSAGSIQVSIGQSVSVAQILGKVGSTGNSTGPHLHFEVRLAGTPVDPFRWLKANAN